jgi:uncharacterized membrane protein
MGMLSGTPVEVDGSSAKERDSTARSIAKAVSYRVFGSAITGLILLVLTRRITLSIVGSVLDMVLKIVAYFLHERIWNLIDFGRGRSSQSGLDSVPDNRYI